MSEREALLIQQETINQQLQQQLEQRANELEGNDKRYSDLQAEYEKVKKQLEEAEGYKNKVKQLKLKIEQQEEELFELQQQNASVLQIESQEKRLKELEQSLDEARKQAEHAKQEALNLKAQLNKQVKQAVQSAASKNPYFGKPKAEWSQEYYQQHKAFKNAMLKINSAYKDPKKMKSCFVSYAWGDDSFDNFQTEVVRMVKYFKLAGIYVPFDRDNIPGKEHTHKFIQNIAKVDAVVICGTKKMMEKYHWKLEEQPDPKANQPVVKTEIDLIESLLTKNEGYQRRMRPVIFDGTMNECLPLLLHNYVYYHFQYVNYFEIIFGLIQSIYGIPNDDKQFKKIKKEFWEEAGRMAVNNNNANSAANQSFIDENAKLKKLVSEQSERIRMLEAQLDSRREKAATNIQALFKDYLLRKQKPFIQSKTIEERKDLVRKHIAQLASNGEFQEVSQLSELAIQNRWYEAIQWIHNYQAKLPTDNNNNNASPSPKPF